MSLSEKLSALNQANRHKIPAEALEVMDRVTTDLKEASITDQIIEPGTIFPDAELLDPENKTIQLEQAMKGRKTIVSFYRGGWCPYCNLELRALQSELKNFETLGAQLIAISPEKPDHSLSSKEKNQLQFKVFSDINNVLAQQLGLVFGLPEDLKNIYLKFGINLEESQGNATWELPVPATFIVDGSGVITHVFANEDYTKRPDPETIKEALKSQN